MQLEFPISLSVKVNGSSSNDAKEVQIHSGTTVIVGPNGSGKSQLLYGIKAQVQLQDSVVMIQPSNDELWEVVRAVWVAHRVAERP